MKQRISPEQLNELTPEQKERLREWWRPQDYDVVYHPGYNINPISYYEHNQTIYLNHGEVTSKVEKEDCLPMLSIGQCIELFKHKTGRLPEIKDYEYLNIITVGLGGMGYPAKELIDALWQAAKAVL